MTKIVSLLLLLAAASGFQGSLYAQEAESPKKVVRAYLIAAGESDFESMAEHINPEWFEKVASKAKIKKAFNSFLNSDKTAENRFGDFEIKTVSEVIEYEKVLYAKVLANQEMIFTFTAELPDKVIQERSDFLNSAHGADNVKKISNGYSVRTDRTYILSKKEGSTWKLIEMMGKNANAKLFPKEALELLEL